MPDVAQVEDAAGGLTGEQVRTLYEALRAQFSARNGEYALARDRYNGKHWDAVYNPATTGRYSLTANYVRPTVDKTVQMLMGELPGIQVMPPGTDPVARRVAEAEEALLYATWDVNGAARVFKRVAHNTVLLRRGLIYYWWDPSLNRVRFRSVAPDNFFPLYDGEEIAECVLVSRRLTRALRASYPNLAAKIVPDADTDAVFDESRWMRVVDGVPDTIDMTGAGSAPSDRENVMLTGHTTVIDWYDREGNWTRVMGAAVHSQKLAYGTSRVPVIEFVNNVPGDERDPSSEVEDIVELNMYADQLLSQQADIIRKYSNPTVIDKGTGQDPQTIRRTVQSEGGVLPIKRDGDLRFLNWEGTPPAIGEQWQRVMAAIYDLSGKPASAYGQTVTNQSGVMTNLALTPSVAVNAYKESLFGESLVMLNEDILRLYEQFSAGEAIDVRGARPKAGGGPRFYEAQIMGREIAGWYKNRIKWPSALRTDDPVFVQNELQKMQSDPPAQSIYTTLENLGIEDVEAEIDRIRQQLEDPRFHPDRLKSAIEAATAFQGAQVPPDLEGLMPPGEGLDAADTNAAAVASASPHRDQLVSSEY